MNASSYKKSAAYYDLIYQGRETTKECDLLERIFKQFESRHVRRILDLGSGTGSHALEMTSRGYQVVGIDILEDFVNIARKKANGVEHGPTFHVGDMRDLNVEGSFDILMSMFGAVGYVAREEVGHTLAGFRRKLRKGGLLLFEYWNLEGTEDGHQSWETREQSDLLLIRLGRTQLDGSSGTAVITFRHFLLRGKALEDDFEEVHRLTLYRQEEMEGYLRDAGFTPLAMLDWDRKVMKPAPKGNFRVFAVAKME